MAYDVTFTSPGTVGVKQVITLTNDGESFGGTEWTVTPGDSGAGGTFDEASLPDSDTPELHDLVFHYTPAAAGTVTFNFTDTQGGDIAYRYSPATLTVDAPASSGGAHIGGRGGIQVSGGVRIGRRGGIA